MHIILSYIGHARAGKRIYVIVINEIKRDKYVSRCVSNACGTGSLNDEYCRQFSFFFEQLPSLPLPITVQDVNYFLGGGLFLLLRSILSSVHRQRILPLSLSLV